MTAKEWLECIAFVAIVVAVAVFVWTAEQQIP